MSSIKRFCFLGFALSCLTGCTVISYDRVFPKVTWAWTAEAKEQRRQNEERKAYQLEKDPHRMNEQTTKEAQASNAHQKKGTK